MSSASRCAPPNTYQLEVFAAAVLRGEPVKTTPDDAIVNNSPSAKIELLKG